MDPNISVHRIPTNDCVWNFEIARGKVFNNILFLDKLFQRNLNPNG